MTDIYRTLRRDVEAALHPVGMSAHDGRITTRLDLVMRLLKERELQAARIAELEAQVAFLQGGLHKNDDTVKWVRKPIPRSGDAP